MYNPLQFYCLVQLEIVEVCCRRRRSRSTPSAVSHASLRHLPRTIPPTLSTAILKSSILIIQNTTHNLETKTPTRLCAPTRGSVPVDTCTGFLFDYSSILVDVRLLVGPIIEHFLSSWDLTRGLSLSSPAIRGGGGGRRVGGWV